MAVEILFSAFLLVIPTYVFCVLLGKGVLFAWWIKGVLILAVWAAYLTRFRHGKWKSMRVIEPDFGADVIVNPSDRGANSPHRVRECDGSIVHELTK